MHSEYKQAVIKRILQGALVACALALTLQTLSLVKEVPVDCPFFTGRVPLSGVHIDYMLH